MINSIIGIGEHMIQASVLKVLNDPKGVEDELIYAELIAKSDGFHYANVNGYNLAFSRMEISEPSYLDTYPELRAAWESGFDNGFEEWQLLYQRSCDEDIFG